MCWDDSYPKSYLSAWSKHRATPWEMGPWEKKKNAACDRRVRIHFEKEIKRENLTFCVKVHHMPSGSLRSLPTQLSSDAMRSFLRLYVAVLQKCSLRYQEALCCLCRRGARAKYFSQKELTSQLKFTATSRVCPV